MIWYLTTEDLMEKYSKRSVKELDKTNYLIMSSRVRTTIERDNVLNITNLFMNAGLLKGVGFNTESDSILAKEEFKNFLLKNPRGLSVICAMIECSILEDEDTVIICTPNELKCDYLQVFCEVVGELFEYPILRYPATMEVNLEEAIQRLLYYKKTVKQYMLSQASDIDRVKMLEKMKKKELKKELKKRGLYSSSMGKEDMIEVLTAFY